MAPIVKASVIGCAAAIGCTATSVAQTDPAPPQVMQRIEPRLYDFRMDIDYLSRSPFTHKRGINVRVTYSEEMRAYVAAGRFWGDLLFPFVPAGHFHAVDEDSLRFFVANGIGGDLPIQPRLLDSVYGTKAIVTRLENTALMGFRSRIAFEIQTWNIVFNEQEAQTIAWPAEWPSGREVRDGLVPAAEHGIDLAQVSETQERYLRAIRELDPDRLKRMPVHLAAKTVVGHVLNSISLVNPIQSNYRDVYGDGFEGERTVIGQRLVWVKNDTRGLQLHGAANTARLGVGTAADVVCVCVNMLRAVGIPARPVIGAVEGDDDKIDEITFEPEPARLICWGEYYLPEVGWVPFDPEVMLDGRHAAARKNLTDPWPGFGGIQNLNERIPIAYRFVAPESENPYLSRYPTTRLDGEPPGLITGGKIFACFGLNYQRIVYRGSTGWEEDRNQSYLPTGTRHQAPTGPPWTNSPTIGYFWFYPVVDIKITDREPGRDQGY